MPKKLLRLLLVLAIALAVPIQGVAAVAAGLCMELGHHQDGQASAHDHSAVQAHDVHKSPSADSKPAGDKSADGSHCPPCVSCCAAAVIAPAAHISIPDSFPAAAITATQYSIAGVLPEKLDRPPLSL